LTPTMASRSTGAFSDGFYELKRRGGRLSDEQRAMRDHLEGCGFAYLCTDSVDEATEWLKHYGILRDRFSVQ
jgi:hypothetical protein